MLRFVILFVLLICFTGIYSQEIIHGVINDYTSGIASTCSNSIITTDASAFSSGDIVLIIQMKGAEVNESNSASFGSITNYHNTGKYEFNTIGSVIDNEIFFTYTLSHPYNFSGIVQLISVPVYDDLIIDSTLTCNAWNGNTGGILAFISEGTVTFQSDIDVSEKGFRGGEQQDYPDSCPFGLSWTGYRTDISSGNGAIKGESFAIIEDDIRAGRGKLASGGGGGNDHNAGGGGGSMGGAGGVGGEREESFFSCPGPGVGQAGVVPDNSNTQNRLYLGGGGGAGHGNNGNGQAGGNGGGIIFLQANTIEGNGFSIKSNGGSPVSANGDGGGGGGAGGSLLLDINSIASDFIVECKGGNGSDITAIGCTGPGGGGGGGLMKHTGADLPLGIFTDLSGGIPGTTITAASPCYESSNGATGGSAGEIISDWPVLFSNEIFNADFASVSEDTTICAGNIITLEASGGVTYAWSPATGLSATDIANPFCNIEEDITYSIIVTNASGCADTALINIDVTPGVNAIAGPDTAMCGANQILFFANGGDTYQWSPSTGVSNINIPNPVVFVTETTDYFVAVSNGTCTDVDTVSVEIFALPVLETNNDTTICLGEAMVLSVSGASTYAWTPVESVPCSDCSFMEVTPTVTTTYSVAGTTADGCTSSNSFTVMVEVCNAIVNELANNFRIYPNPTTSVLHIELMEIPDESLQFNVYSTVGEKVISKSLSAGENKFEISVDNLPAGNYLYMLDYKNENLSGLIIIE